MPQLILLSDPASDTPFELDKPETRIGRAPANDIVLDHDRVSRSHAMLTVEGPFVTLHDLQSRNGVYVNGTRIQSQILMSGDELRIGECLLRFVDGGFTSVEAERLDTVPGLLVELEPVQPVQPAQSLQPSVRDAGGKPTV